MENLQIDAAGGNIRFGDAVGGIKSLGNVVIAKAHDVNITAGLQAKTLTHLLGSGTTTFGGATTLKEKASYQEAHRELRSVDLVLFAPRYIQFCLGRDFAADLEVARGVARALLGNRKVPVRIVENLTAMLLGVHLFEEFADIPLLWFANEVMADPKVVGEWVYPGLGAGRSTHFHLIKAATK